LPVPVGGAKAEIRINAFASASPPRLAITPLSVGNAEASPPDARTEYQVSDLLQNWTAFVFLVSNKCLAWV
jgi:hypothetical protein